MAFMFRGVWDHWRQANKGLECGLCNRLIYGCGKKKTPVMFIIFDTLVTSSDTAVGLEILVSSMKVVVLVTMAMVLAVMAVEVVSDSLTMSVGSEVPETVFSEVAEVVGAVRFVVTLVSTVLGYPVT